MKKLIPIFYLLSFTFYLLSFTSFAQTWQELDSIRNIYMERQSYDTALIYAEKALQTVKELTGENDTLYANMLKAIVEINYYSGKYSKAIEYGEKEKEIRKTVQGEKHPDYASSLNNLAILYMDMGNYSKAKPLYIQALNIHKEALGVIHPYYASSLNNLAELYSYMGNYSQAEPLYIQAMSICKETLGEKHPDYATSLNNLAYLYCTMGNYSQAEPLYIQAMNLWKEFLGEKHPLYATSLNNLALLYHNMGNYAKAEPLFTQAMNIRKETLSEKHPDYATSLGNLAYLYCTMGNYSKAEPLLIEAMSIWKETLGEKHPDYATSLNNLAVLYYNMGNYFKAEPLFIEAMNIWKETLGEKHPDYAQSLNNLAALYNVIGNYAKAEPLLLEAINIRKEVLGEKHPDYAQSLNNLAKLNKDMGNFTAAVPLYLEYLEIINEHIAQNFAFLSEKEKEMYFKTQTGAFEGFYSFSLRYKTENPEITKTAFNNVVKNKGLLLKSSTAMRTAILNSNDTALISNYEKWLTLKKEISKLYSTEISKREKNPEELEQQANAIEKDLVRNSQIFSDFNKLQNLTWESVKNSLKPGEAAVEFIHFAEGKKMDTVTYCALILKPDSKYPEMLPLFEERQILKILNAASGNNYNQVNSIYGTNAKTNDALYKLIWQPLEKYLEGVKTVYYSPDGLLHKVSFAALAKEKNLYLCDNYNLQHVSTTGKVAMSESSSLPFEEGRGGAVLTAGIFGGIEYSTDTTTHKLWPYLSGTLTEAEGIKNKFESRKVPVALYSGKNATEESFKRLFGSQPSVLHQTLSGFSTTDRSSQPSAQQLVPSIQHFSILHIATHGFFYPVPEEKQREDTIKQEVSEAMLAFRGGTSGFGLWQFVKNKNPLMRSGLVLAGANNVWNQRFVGEGEDGVLTAQEVTQLDLRKTQLVVLSACETGLGDIRGSEGVYGLQRAFKMAGVKYIIMSLWQVSDKETEEFMTHFYEKLLRKKDVRKAFNETQKEMRKKYDPYFWAAFVLIE